jgi:tetratricopeptide (TPR) repeat protein
MRILFTIFILSLFCLKLSAAVFQADTPKVHSSDPKVLAAAKDTTKSAVLDSTPVPTVVKTDSAELTATKALAGPKVKAPYKSYNDDADYTGFRRVTSGIQLDSLKQVQLEELANEARVHKLILQAEKVKIAAISKINDLDSLKTLLKQTTADTLRGVIYTRIAEKYLGMDNDSLSGEKEHRKYEDAVISYTLKAIHEYSSYTDSTGLRVSYTNLSTAYLAESKYTEAKWFILQANTIARYQADTVNIISTLLSLAGIKSQIKDYDLAMGDLDKAMALAGASHRPKTQLVVLTHYAYLYSILQNYQKEAGVLKRRDQLQDSINRAEAAELARQAALKKKQEAAAKKKLYLASLKKSSKTTPAPKVASL